MNTGLSLLDTTRYIPTVPECRTRQNCYSCAVEPCSHAVRTHEAVRLIQAGARTTLVYQLTNLPKKYVKRLYVQLIGHPSPRGMTPFTDAWFRESEQRMLHAATVWRIYRLVESVGRSKARELLDIYDLYCYCVTQPLLDITRIVAVLKLVTMSVWEAKHCEHCQKLYLTPVDENLGCSCPGCRIYHRFRCSECGAALSIYTLGRPRQNCPSCTAKHKR